MLLKKGVKFIDHDSNFRYRNDMYKDELLKSDKLYLSAKGVNTLIANMGLKEKVKFATHGGNNWWKQFTLKGGIPDRIPKGAQFSATYKNSTMRMKQFVF